MDEDYEYYTEDLMLTPADSMKKNLPMEVCSKILENLTLESDSILNFRKVGPQFRKELDKLLLSAKCPKLEPLTVDGVPWKSLCPTKIPDLFALTEFQNQMEYCNTNPFPTRSLRISPFNPKLCTCVDYCYCVNNRVFDSEHYRVSKFCQLFGCEVYRLAFDMINRDATSHTNVIRHFPYLRHLEIKMVGGAYLEFTVGSFDWVKDFLFPPLPYLTSLKLHFCDIDSNELLTTKLIQAYGTQIKTLTVSMFSYSYSLCYPTTTSFGEVSLADIPNLKILKVRFMPERTQHLLNFLRNGTWPLKQLTLHAVRSPKLTNYKLTDVMDLLSRYASTLQIVHLHFPDHSRFMLRLQCLSKPNKLTPAEVANELRLSIKLPFVQELSLPYNCVKKEYLPTAKLCQKFENLKILHLYDDRLMEERGFDVQKQNYEEELKVKWWPFLSPASKLEQVIIFSGNEFDENVVVLKVIEKPSI